MVTFLFTDVEGSTRRWEADADSMRAALADHGEVLRSVIEAHGGFLFKHTGDGVCAAFASPRSAADAAVAAQRALELPVRMGLATGEAELRNGDYFGAVLNRAARVMAAGHGGQVLVAESTAGLLSGLDLLDLGPRRLRDVPMPVGVFQLQAEGLRTEFPPLRALDTTPGNLRPATTSLIGRESEITDIQGAIKAKHQLRNALLVPTTLRLMKQVPNLGRFNLNLRSLISGGEAVGAEIIEWTQQALHVRINEAFGQTECNLVLGHNASLMQPKPGSLGRPIPGHIGAVVDDEGHPLPASEVGHIAFRRPDPVMLLEYWNNPQATKDKFVGDWLLTGDLGQRDEDGYFWYRGRADDVITSAGYRIGPGEIEEALLRHPAVRLAAVIGVPDPVRTESIKAFLVLTEGQQPSEALEHEICEFVKTRLARHEYPRAIEFVDSLPTTTTGKIMRRELRERERAKL
ncbi:AMP-binding protein [Mycobacterium sp. 1164985.4]|uniref:AMP-binding enzyme n=1 Tax=Mycobacterium sp. 1164985.4 TaxID=1834069 RepID=UPI000800F990|nr:hypothetical protein A5650_15425 [Mycobacterium sp. 1164985.4]